MTTTKEAATERPWSYRWDDRRSITDPKGNMIALLSHVNTNTRRSPEEVAANANLIVEAVNSYDALRARVAELDPFEALEANCWDLRCIDIPTGGGDADVGWNVIEHHMAAPKERIVGTGNSPIAAIRAALGRAEQ